jgi:branched-chain amino acid transport system substrate-binding protein
MDMRGLRWLCGVALLAATAAAGQSGQSDGALEIRIGHVAPLTGGIAHLGKDNENGARLAIEEANAAGLSIGGRPARFVLIAEDDQADPKVGVTAAQKLVEARIAGVVGHLNSGTSIPAGRIYDAAGIPAISGSATNPRLTEQGYKGQFRVIGRDDGQGEAIGRFLNAVRRFQTFAVLDDATAYGQSSAGEVARTLQSLGRKVTVRFGALDRDKPDWRPAIEEILRQQPDAVFIGGMDDAGAPFMKQAREAGVRAVFFMADGGCLDGIARLSGGAAEGMLCTQSGVPPNMVMAQFGDAYRKRFGAAPILYAPFTYDATQLLIAAMVRADSAEPARILPELAKMEYTGVTGRIAFDAKGDRKDAEVTVFILRQGRLAPFAIVQGERVMSPSDFVGGLLRLAPAR